MILILAKTHFPKEHSRLRNVINFMVNLVSGLVAYSLKNKKPSLNFNAKQIAKIMG